jgi:hypothetical protein
VLVLASQSPWPPHSGARIRLRAILRHLRARYRVTLLAHGVPGDLAASEGEAGELCDRIELFPLGPTPAEQLGRLVPGLSQRWSLLQSFHHSAAMAQRIGEITAQEPVDIVHFEFAWIHRPPCGRWVCVAASASPVLCQTCDRIWRARLRSSFPCVPEEERD